MGSPPQRAVGKRDGEEGWKREGGEGRGGGPGSVDAETRRVYALGLGLLCVLVEPLLPWMVRLISSFFSFSSSFCSSFSSSFSLKGRASAVSSEAMGA